MESQRILRKRTVEMLPTENPKIRVKKRNHQAGEPLPSTRGDAQRNDEKGGEREKLLEQIKQLKKEFRKYRKGTNRIKKSLEDKDMQLKEVKKQQLKIKKELQKAEEERLMWRRGPSQTQHRGSQSDRAAEKCDPENLPGLLQSSWFQ